MVTSTARFKPLSGWLLSSLYPITLISPCPKLTTRGWHCWTAGHCVHLCWVLALTDHHPRGGGEVSRTCFMAHSQHNSEYWYICTASDNGLRTEPSSKSSLNQLLQAAACRQQTDKESPGHCFCPLPSMLQSILQPSLL